jgi:O-antigen/teichoic acid export membrane protein
VDPSEITLQENLAKGALVNLVGKLAGRAIHIGTQIVLARWLGPALFGLYAIGWNLLRVGTSILPFGIDIALLQIGPSWWPKEPKKISRLFQTAAVVILAVSLAAGLFLFSASDWISNLYSKPELSLVMRLLALALPFALLLRVASYATRVTQQMQFGIISEEIIQPVSNLGLAVVLLLLGGGLSGALWATNISFGLALLYTIFTLVKIFPSVWSARIQFDRSVFSKLWSASAPLAIAAVFTTLILLVDRLMVGFILSEQEAGLYQAASIFAVFFVTVLSAFKTIIAPMVAAAFDRGDTKGIAESFRMSTRWGIYLSIPVAVVLILTPETILEVLFGTAYVSSSATLIALTLGQLANVLSGPLEYYLIMTGSTKSWVWINAAMLIVNIGLNLVLIPRLGILGAGISTAVTFTLISIIGLLAVHRKLRISPYDLTYVRGLLAAFGMILGLVVVRIFDIQPLWLELATLAFIAPILFFLLVWILGIDPAEQKLLAAVLRRSNN